MFDNEESAIYINGDRLNRHYRLTYPSRGMVNTSCVYTYTTSEMTQITTKPAVEWIALQVNYIEQFFRVQCTYVADINALLFNRLLLRKSKQHS